MPHSPNHTPLPLEEQLRAVIDEGWEQDVLPMLPAGYEHFARELKAFQRHRGLRCVADLLRALLAYVLCAASLRQLGAWAVLIGLADLSHVAWLKRLRQARGWLLWLLAELLALPQPTVLDWNQQPSRVVLVDGTRIKQPGGCGDDWRVHLGYDLLHARLVDVRVSDRHTAEGFTLFDWHAGDIVVADRGYSRRGQIAWVLEQGAHIVVRLAVHQFLLLDENGLPLDVHGWLKGKPAGRHLRTVSFLFQERTFHLRLIAQSLSKEAAERARAKARRKANKQQRHLQEETLLLAGWLLILTSLPIQTWSDEHVLCLYRARWQIELVIKRMKQVLKLAHLRGKTQETNEATLLAVLVCWALQEQEALRAREVFSQAIASLCESTAPTLSSWGLTALCVQTLRVSVQGYWTPARLRTCLPRLTRFVCSRRIRRRQQEWTIRQSLLARFGPCASTVSLLFSCSSA